MSPTLLHALEAWYLAEQTCASLDVNVWSKNEWDREYAKEEAREAYQNAKAVLLREYEHARDELLAGTDGGGR